MTWCSRVDDMVLKSYCAPRKPLRSVQWCSNNGQWSRAVTQLYQSSATDRKHTILLGRSSGGPNNHEAWSVACRRRFAGCGADLASVCRCRRAAEFRQDTNPDVSSGRTIHGSAWRRTGAQFGPNRLSKSLRQRQPAASQSGGACRAYFSACPTSTDAESDQPVLGASVSELRLADLRAPDQYDHPNQARDCCRPTISAHFRFLCSLVRAPSSPARQWRNPGQSANDLWPTGFDTLAEWRPFGGSSIGTRGGPPGAGSTGYTRANV